MRVCFWGNQDNNAYKMAKVIRAKGIQCALYIFSNDNPRSYPELIDTELSPYPIWIKVYDNSSDSKLVVLSRKTVKEINSNFDLIIASGVRGILSSHNFSLPVVCYYLGSDLNKFPFPIHFKLFSPATLLSAILLRYSFHKSRALAITGREEEIIAVSKLKLEHKCFFALPPEDVKLNKSLINKELANNLKQKYSKYSKLFIWLSRISYSDKRIADYKGTDIFIKSLEVTQKDLHSNNVKILLAEHGPDVNKMKAWVKASNLDNLIEYIPHQPYTSLLSYLALPNAIIFDAVAPNRVMFGGLSREALSLGCVLVRAYNEDVVEQNYGKKCPVINARNVPELSNVMRMLSELPQSSLVEKRKDALAWSRKYMNPNQLITPWIKKLYEIHRLEQLKKKYVPD